MVMLVVKELLDRKFNTDPYFVRIAYSEQSVGFSEIRDSHEGFPSGFL